MNQKEVEERGYKFGGPCQAGIIVWKNGFYGIIDRSSGEEITPCVHINTNNAIHDVGRGKLQKILKDSIEDDKYSPYTGAVVGLLLEKMAIPESISNGNSSWQRSLTKEEYAKVALSTYILVNDIMNNGGAEFVMYDHGNESEQFREFCEKLKDLTGIEDYYFGSALKQEILLKKHTTKSLAEPSEFELETIGNLENMKPMFIISSEMTSYNPDCCEPHTSLLRIKAEDYKKGVDFKEPKNPRRVVHEFNR